MVIRSPQADGVGQRRFIAVRGECDDREAEFLDVICDLLTEGAELIRTWRKGKGRSRSLDEKKSNALRAYTQTNGIEAINKYYDSQVEWSR
jgi:hypothetical protein